MIQLHNVHKIFRSQQRTFTALKNVNLNVKTGEIYGVIGKSGAGKSTLLRCMNLLERPTSGQVTVDGQELTSLSTHELRLARRHIGMIFQGFNLLSTRSVYENIALPLELEGYSSQQIKEIVAPLLQLTQLESKRNVYPAQLSGGQKQRVAIARALACQPKVLLCDEATSALDLHTTKAILSLLQDINKQLNLTIILITHELEVVKDICDRVAILENGEIVEENTVFKFFSQPTTPLAKELVKTALKQELPEHLKVNIQQQPAANTNPLLQIIFYGHAATEPFIAHLILEIGINLNILQGNIEFLPSGAIGVMLVEVLNTHDKLQLAMSYLQEKNIQAEVIGHVRRTIS
jgi:D-methionine transport system ATP-binding protein